MRERRWRMQRRFMVLVTVVLAMVAMLVVTAAPAMARPIICPYEGCPRPTGTALPTVVCESPVAASPLIGWRDGQCWVFHPVAVTL